MEILKIYEKHLLSIFFHLRNQFVRRSLSQMINGYKVKCHCWRRIVIISQGILSNVGIQTWLSMCQRPRSWSKRNLYVVWQVLTPASLSVSLFLSGKENFSTGTQSRGVIHLRKPIIVLQSWFRRGRFVGERSDKKVSWRTASSNESSRY